MSLLQEVMEKCVILDKRTIPDGYGGYTVEWADGAEIEAAIAFNSSLEARVAEQQGVTSVYTVVVPKTVVLDYHDVFRRVSDGKVFRVTSDGSDNYTPKSSSLDIRQVSAEEWSLPNG